jgi:hypothetical protein
MFTLTKYLHMHILVVPSKASLISVHVLECNNSQRIAISSAP